MYLDIYKLVKALLKQLQTYLKVRFSIGVMWKKEKLIKRFELNKTKKLFLFFGILNFLITNFFLQVSLILMPTFLAAILSQIINVSI